MSQFESKQKLKKAPTLAKITTPEQPKAAPSFNAAYAYESAIADSEKTINSIAQKTKSRKTQEEKERQEKEIHREQVFAQRMVDKSRNKF